MLTEMKDKLVNAGWICTDPDTMQFVKRISDANSVWTIRQLANLNANSIEEMHFIETTIDLTDYSKEELQEYLDAFGHDYDELHRESGSIDAQMITVECVFETDYLLDGMSEFERTVH